MEIPSPNYPVIQRLSLNHLFDLYISISGPILSEWIDDRSLYFLDVSVCNASQRPKLLEIFRLLSISNIEVYDESYHKKNKWILSRGLQVRNMLAKIYFNDDEREILSKTKILHHLDCDVRYLLEVIRVCPRIKSLSLHDLNPSTSKTFLDVELFRGLDGQDVVNMCDDNVRLVQMLSTLEKYVSPLMYYSELVLERCENLEVLQVPDSPRMRIAVSKLNNVKSSHFLPSIRWECCEFVANIPQIAVIPIRELGMYETYDAFHESYRMKVTLY